MSTKLMGRILLQVEDKGQAWYVEPMSGMRAFLGRPADAFSIMRSFGLGITNANLQKIALQSDADIDRSFAQKLSGRILLQVESHGEAWYVNPVNLKRYYLGRPADAFNLMRQLGLGISDIDIAEISIDSNFQETSTPPVSTPTISNLNISNITDSGATITWSSSSSDVSVIRYGKSDTDTGRSLIATTSGTSLEHMVTLTGLASSTDYFFRIVSGTQTGNPVESMSHTFRTATPPAPSTHTYNISMQNYAFNPETMTIKSGDTVIWTNKDSATHNVTTVGPATSTSFASGQLNQGQTYSHTFNSVGTYSYMCTIHPNMRGTIIVQ